MTHPFAPGTIEHHARRRINAAQRRELARWLKRSALLITASMLVAFVLGLFA